MLLTVIARTVKTDALFVLVMLETVATLEIIFIRSLRIRIVTTGQNLIQADMICKPSTQWERHLYWNELAYRFNGLCLYVHLIWKFDV